VPLNIIFGGALTRYKPGYAKGSLATMQNAAGLTVEQVLLRLEIPPEQPMLMILNGDIVESNARSQTVLKDDDNLSLMSPIQAG